MTQNQRPRILVTGVAGALAQQVVARLRSSFDIVAVDFREQVYLGDDIPSYCIDFNKRVFEDLFRRYQFDSVIHLGRVQASQLTRARRYNANVLGTQKLLDLSRKYNITQVIVLSTYHVYGADPYNPALLNENAPLKAAGLSMDLVDSVELENLANIYLWRYPDLNITILRPCNIVGPGVRNTISNLLASKRAPVLAGFSPMMQFIHIDDMVSAIVLAYETPKKGVYNVAPEDWVTYKRALAMCGCKKALIPSIPPALPKLILQTLNMRGFPPYLMLFFKYPVILDGQNFAREFDFKPDKTLSSIFRYYQENKNPV